MTPPITATKTRTLTVCVLCAADIPHTRCDTALPVAQRTTITATAPTKPLHDYLPFPGQAIDQGYPAI